MSNQGFNGETPIWYYQGETVPVRSITPCHDVNESIRHTGWYCDKHCEDKAFGIIGALSHGRFIAGYETTCNGEQVFFGDVFTDASEAANMADEHARVIADAEMDHSIKFNEARELEEKIERKKAKLCELFDIRNNPCAHWSTHPRKQIKDVIQSIRDLSETLNTDYVGVL